MTAAQHPTGWRKSSRSNQDTDCIEVGRIGDGAAVRDTKNRERGYFTTTSTQWANFLHAVKTGRYEN